MENDCMYTLGRGHKVCQDYARSGPGFALLSDGCSSSADSDLGARHLVAAAALRIREYGAAMDHRWVAQRASRAALLLGSLPTCLDATLLMAHCQRGGGLQVSAAGDGVIALRMRSGRLVSYHLDDGGAPAYLSYLLDEARKRYYFGAGYHTRRVTRRIDGLLVSQHEQRLATDFVFRMALDPSAVEAVFLFSDGVSSFLDADSQPVSEQSVVHELCAIKGYRGAFVQRRARAFLGKMCKKRGWQHEDDLSMAALFLGRAGETSS